MQVKLIVESKFFLIILPKSKNKNYKIVIIKIKVILVKKTVVLLKENLNNLNNILIRNLNKIS
jgi:hypothetical protein